MIGVIAEKSERWAAAEFFQLFKTPWEWYRNGKQYDIVISSQEVGPEYSAANTVILFSNLQPAKGAGEDRGEVRSIREVGSLLFEGDEIPIYTGRIVFREDIGSVLVDMHSGLSACRCQENERQRLVHVGYNLFREVEALLTVGQPASNAHIPTIERHIALLRSLILLNGGSIDEIPPVPDGYRFIACLTHDVDHPSLCKHKFDHTAWGFLYRATVRSLVEVVKGRRDIEFLTGNLMAAAKLPFIYMGMAKDFWTEFDRYRDIEGQCKSSYFVIPFQGNPGRSGSGLAPSKRAAGYRARDISSKIETLVARGSEVGLHGINAWLDGADAAKELMEIRSIIGRKSLGVRMHWLYFNDTSAGILEQAGAEYDSSIGYNETVGYRAGTTQVYRPRGVERLLELPLHIMDTALFYPSHLNLSPADAMGRISEVIENAVRYGGCVTLNWHDRSIFPERCWDEVYRQVLELLKARGAWFGTAAETTRWFQLRRSLYFNGNSWSSEDGAFATASGEFPGFTHRLLSLASPSSSATHLKVDRPLKIAS